MKLARSVHICSKLALFSLLAFPAFAHLPDDPNLTPISGMLDEWTSAWGGAPFPAAPVTAPTPASPSVFYGLGVSAQPQSSPKPTGNAFLAILANEKARIYSFTAMDFAPTLNNPRSIQTSISTGAATPLRSFGSVTLYGLGTAGVATGGGSSSGAFSGGGLLSIPIHKGSAFKILLAVRVLKTAAGGTQQLIGLGFGRAQ